MEKVNSYRSAIIVPCYNENARLSVENFIDYMKIHPQHAFCFLNDGSTDKTMDLLNEIKIECTNGYVISLEKNVGKAVAVYNGIKYALKNIEAEFYGYLDADLATPLSFISIMENEMKLNQPAMVFGSRQLADKQSVERKVFRHYSGRLVSGFISWALDTKYGDTQCGAKLFSKEGATIGFQKPFLSSWVFDVEIIKRLLLHFGREESKTQIKEIPVNQWKDVGNSKVSTFYIFKMCKEIWGIKRMK